MPTSSGPNTLGESNLVFAYDTGDVSNSYRGKPGYNVLGTPYAWVGNSTATYFKTNVSTTTVNIPAIGTREVATVSILNDYPNSGNCCPSLWRYGDWGITNGVVGNTLYTYSIIYKTNSGYTHPNFMYRYEYNGGSYILETGVFDTAKRIDLGDGWYQAYNTFTTNASTNVMYLGMWYYQYGVQDTVYLYKASLTQGAHTFPPEQIIPPSTTRSATQGLLPLVGNSTLDLTNMSFDSSAKMVFDGTNDYISIPTYTFGNGNWTLNMLINANDFNNFNLMSNTSGGPVTNAFGAYSSKIFYYNYDGSWQSHSGNTTLSTGTWYMLTWVNYAGATANLGTMQMFVNGIADSSVFNSYTTNGGPCNAIGANWYSSFNGKIDAVQVYNKSLTAQEVKQNYQQYKTRFNLS